MRRHTAGALATLFIAPVTLGWAAPTDVLTLQPQSRLWIDGSSTVRRFTCRAGAIETTVETSGPGAVSALLAGEKAVRAVAVRVPAEKLECGNDKMNEHMWKSIKAKENATIEFRVTGYEMERADGALHGTLTGTLSLGGVQRPIAVRAEGRSDAAGALHVVGSHEIRMSEFGLKAPTLMMGTLKVDEHVKVNFELYLKG